MSRRRIKRVVLGLLLSIVLIGAAGVYIAWRLSWQQPAWYAPPNPKDARIVTLADDTEYQLLEQTQMVRPVDEAWALRITQAQINAWLAARLPRWIEHDANMTWPEQIGTPQVLIDAAGLRIATPVTIGPTPNAAASATSASRTVVATLVPTIAADGGLSLKLTSIALGKVWVPGAPLTRLVDAVKEASPEFLDHPQVRQAIEVLSGRQSLPAEYTLADGRRVRVKDVRLVNGAIEVSAVTIVQP